MSTTINLRPVNPSVLSTDVLPTGKGGSNPDVKTSMTQVANFSQSSFTNKSNQIYISDKQAGTGTGTDVNPFATGDEAAAIAGPNSILVFDSGSYTMSDFAMFPGAIMGQGSLLTTITMSNLTLNDTAWQAATNPKMMLKGFSLSGDIGLISSASKSGSEVLASDIRCTNFRADKIVEVEASTVRASVDIIDNNCDIFRVTNGSKIGQRFQVTMFGMNGQSPLSDSEILEVLVSADNSMIVSHRNITGLQLFRAAASSGNTVQPAFDAQSWPVNGIEDINQVGVIPVFLSNVANGINTFDGFGINYDIATGSYGSFAGMTAGADPTLFVSRGGSNALPPVSKNSVFLGTSFETPGNPFDEVFLASDASVPLVSNKEKVFAVSYANGHGFGAVPKANFDVRARTKGDFLFSASTVVADADMAGASLVNPWTSGQILKFKYRDAFGTIQEISLNPTVVVTSSGSLPANGFYIIDTLTTGTYTLGAMNVGDTTIVLIRNTGQAQIGTFGSQIVSYLDAGMSVSSDTFITTKKNQFVTFKCVATNNIIITSSNGEIDFSNGQKQNPLGNNPTLIGNVGITGDLNVTGTIVDVPRLSLPNIFTGLNTFSAPMLIKEVQNPLVENITPSSYTATSGTISPSDLATGEILFESTADSIWAFPQGVDINNTLNNPAVGRGKKGIRLINNTEFNVTFSTNTNLAFSGVTISGVLVLGPYCQMTIDLGKVGSPNSYAVFGNSGLSTIKAVSPLYVETVGNVSYYILRTAFQGSVTAVSGICRSGSCTATFGINNSPMTTAAVSVSTGGGSQNPTAANNFTALDYLTVAVTGNTLCLGMTLTVHYIFSQRL